MQPKRAIVTTPAVKLTLRPVLARSDALRPLCTLAFGLIPFLLLVGSTSSRIWSFEGFVKSIIYRMGILSLDNRLSDPRLSICDSSNLRISSIFDCWSELSFSRFARIAARLAESM